MAGTVRLCESSGLLALHYGVGGGAVRSVAWSCDGARLAVGGAAGMLAVGHTVQRRAEWRQYSAVLEAPTRIRVQVRTAEAGSAQSGPPDEEWGQARRRQIHEQPAWRRAGMLS